jgi:hypothetical protein
MNGGANWGTWKTILGWLIDTNELTVKLPPHRIARLFKLLASITPGQRQISINKWQKLLGKLRSMVMSVPGGRGLFSLLQEVLSPDGDSDSRIRLSSAVYAILQDFSWMVPTSNGGPLVLPSLSHPDNQPLLELMIPLGLGWEESNLSPPQTGAVQPFLWRSRFDKRIPERLVTFANPGGTITNSDLKLAAIVAQHDILARAA